MSGKDFNLLIVESSTKAKTIAKYLRENDDRWEVRYTNGHIKDLPPKEYALTYRDDSVSGKWEMISTKAKQHMASIRKLAKEANYVYIATDDDREGERIAADVAEFIDVEEYERVVFREITRQAINEELYSSIRPISHSVKEAAIANRFVDREIGYPISNILKRTMNREGLEKGMDYPRGVGRVLSPALAVICLREKQIDNFQVEKYNSVQITYTTHEGKSFDCHNDRKFPIANELELNRYMDMLRNAEHKVYQFDEKIESVQPHVPLHTQALQYSAWYVLEIMPENLMKIAQKLFEYGLITYHRTDSIRLSRSAVKRLRAMVQEQFGIKYLSTSPRYYDKKKKKDGEKENEKDGENNEVSRVQDAHEAIRPANLTDEFNPRNIRGNAEYNLSDDEERVYRLIWARTLITQMADALVDRSVIHIEVGAEVFISRANWPVFEGWKKAHDMIMKVLNKEKAQEESKNSRRVDLPRIPVATQICPLEIAANERTTKAPKRYGIGTFVRTVYNWGFGRPSTIGTLVKNLRDKNYIRLIGAGIIEATPLGHRVNDWTQEHFGWLVDFNHAKELEDKLQKIENGDTELANELVIAYHKMIKEGAMRQGIEDFDAMMNEASIKVSKPPTDKQIKLALSIAEEKKITLDKETLNDGQKLSRFIDRNTKKVRLRKCPYCSEGTVFEIDRYIVCDRRKECGFVVPKTKIYDFFINFKRPIKGDDKLIDAVRGMMLKKGYEAMLVSKAGKEFKAKLGFKPSKKYGWHIDFLK